MKTNLIVWMCRLIRIAERMSEDMFSHTATCILMKLVTSRRTGFVHVNSKGPDLLTKAKIENTH